MYEINSSVTSKSEGIYGELAKVILNGSDGSVISRWKQTIVYGSNSSVTGKSVGIYMVNGGK